MPFASSPQQCMRVLGRSYDRRSRSQLTQLLAVHVFLECPFKPWRATMLKTDTNDGCVCLVVGFHQAGHREVPNALGVPPGGH